MRSAGPLLLAAGGVAAAFGAASCCAIPLLLSALGLGSTWLITVAWIAAPHRVALLTVAAVSLAAAGALFWRRRRVAASGICGCASPATTVAVAGLLSLGAALAVLGWIYA